MFVRLVVPGRDRDSHQAPGVFSVAYELRDAGWLPGEERDRLAGLLHWFEDHLILPDRGRLTTRAIFWFRDGTTDLSRRLWELATVVSDHGPRVERLRTSRPGAIVYEDTQQVAAIPFRDTFRAVRRATR